MSPAPFPECATSPVKNPRNRRLHRRYPLHMEMRYRLVSGKQILDAGSGRIRNVSSRGLFFETERPLPARAKTVELSIDWPAKLEPGCPLRLLVLGTLVRSHGNQAAIRMIRYEFRTRGTQSLHAPAAPLTRSAIA